MGERWGKARVEGNGEWEQMGGGLVTEIRPTLFGLEPPPFRVLALAHVKVKVNVSVKVSLKVKVKVSVIADRGVPPLFGFWRSPT